MPSHINHLGQPIGAPLDNWAAPAPLQAVAMDGLYCRLEPLAEDHIPPLFHTLAEEKTDGIWTYLPNGPFASAFDLRSLVDDAPAKGLKPLAIIDKASGRVLGTACYMRIDPANGVAEIGYVVFSPAMQRSRLSTEAIYLMMRHMFETGYRRVEWKCNALHTGSCRAALRYGFSYEGVFRQAVVVKGHNRDTAWFACMDGEWPQVKTAIETWLAPENFDETGRQILRLSALTRGFLHWPKIPDGV